MKSKANVLEKAKDNKKFIILLKKPTPTKRVNPKKIAYEDTNSEE